MFQQKLKHCERLSKNTYWGRWCLDAKQVLKGKSIQQLQVEHNDILGIPVLGPNKVSDDRLIDESTGCNGHFGLELGLDFFLELALLFQSIFLSQLS